MNVFADCLFIYKTKQKTAEHGIAVIGVDIYPLVVGENWGEGFINICKADGKACQRIVTQIRTIV